MNRHQFTRLFEPHFWPLLGSFECPKLAYFVEKLGFINGLGSPLISWTESDGRFGCLILGLHPKRFPLIGLYAQLITPFVGKGVHHFAIRRRFWAVAASRNSSCAPLNPLSRSRSSFRMRLRWANSISTFFLSLRDCL